MSYIDTLPLITVRIPAYNHEQYVCSALDSVKRQEYGNIEIVIIDDGSTDNTAARISEWIESNGGDIKVVFRSRKNRGVSATINELVDMSNGDYLVGLASDDELLPESIVRRYEYLKRHPHKMAVFGDSIVVDADGKKIFDSGIADLHGGDKEKYGTDTGLKREIIQNWSTTGSCIMMRRALHDRFQYDESLTVEDRDFYLQMVSEGLLGFIDHPVSAYRMHETNASVQGKDNLATSLNKFKSLTKNARRFPLKDRHLFIKPTLSSFFGIVVYYAINILKSLSSRGASG
ncbi:MAG: glycosyltransferase family 2 protein [Woeseia sp.]|nr:glycosyltransferase family 2 protein [Woeseia sp.]